MKIIISILALFSAAVSTSSARLGETEAECEARYGKCIAVLSIEPSALADSSLAFLKEGIKVTISFWKGRAVEVLYGSESLRALSRDGVLTLLAANAAGSEWVRVETNSRPQVQAPARNEALSFSKWTRKDGLATACFDPNNGLSISDSAFQDALKAHHAAIAAAASEAEKARLKGF